MAQENACEHKYQYAGMRYAVGANPLPGSGAKKVYYAHVYFCDKCLSSKGELVADVEANSYQEIRFGATPGSKEECCVPSYDLRYGRY